ncbi:MAG: amino acid permease [Candidatus Bathyarchaeota archaeon]|nr:amino acid permease [Candidatus Bathyarchaeota archaeon]
MQDKKISVKVATAVGLGAIIGAGIFVLSGTAIALAGSASLIAFVIVGVIALIVALELGELGSIMPQAEGGSYSYAYEAFGSELGFVTGIMLYFAYASSIAPIALGFGSYLTSLLGVSSNVYPTVFAIALILVLAVVNILGVSKAAKADFALVIVKIGILLLFIVFALLFAFGNGDTISNNFTSGFQSANVGSIFAASVVIFFAYSGFQAISTITKDVKGGGAGAAKAIVSSVVISMVLYILVVVALLFLMPASQYGISSDPLSFALRTAGAPGWLFTVVSIGALIATTSAALAMIMGSSRVLYQIGTDKLLPKIVRKYNEKRDVAVNGVIISAAIGIVMLFSGDIYVMASISNFGILFCYLIASFALVHFRRKKAPAGFKVPLYPVLPIIAIGGLIALLIGMPQEALVIGIAMILVLITVYYVLVEAESRKVEKIEIFN